MELVKAFKKSLLTVFAAASLTGCAVASPDLVQNKTEQKSASARDTAVSAADVPVKFKTTSSDKLVRRYPVLAGLVSELKAETDVLNKDGDDNVSTDLAVAHIKLGRAAGGAEVLLLNITGPLYSGSQGGRVEVYTRADKNQAFKPVLSVTAMDDIYLRAPEGGKPLSLLLPDGKGGHHIWALDGKTGVFAPQAKQKPAAASTAHP